MPAKNAEHLIKLFVGMEEPTLRGITACKDCPRQTAVQMSQFCSREGMKPQVHNQLEKPCDPLDNVGSDAYIKAKEALIQYLLGNQT